MTADSRKSELRIVDLALQPDHDTLLEQVYREVLIPSFRPDELFLLEELRSQFSENPPTRDLAAAVDDTGTVLGAALGEWAPDSGVYLLLYLAVRPGLRSGGVGTRLMQYIPSWWRQRGALLSLAEVDDPRRYEVTSTGDPAGRLVFYERFGAQLLDLPYFQPRLSPAGHRGHGMLLLALDVHPDALVDDGHTAVIRGDLLAGYLRHYFDNAEGSEHDDPERARLFGRASAMPGVRLLPVGQYTEVEPDVEIPGGEIPL
jgi:GNAT superfamily N-acetyltransferase